MKTIDLNIIDCYFLSQEDVMHLDLPQRKAYALHQCAKQLARQYGLNYAGGLQIAKDSLTHLKVNYA